MEGWVPKAAKNLIKFYKFFIPIIPLFQYPNVPGAERSGV